MIQAEASGDQLICRVFSVVVESLKHQGMDLNLIA